MDRYDAIDLLVNKNHFTNSEIKTLSELRTLNDETILHFLAIENQLDLVTKCIHIGLDVNSVNQFGDSPLIDIMSLHHLSMARLLLENGANVNYQNEEGDTALHRAYDYGEASDAMLDLLMSYDVDISLRNIYNQTPIDTKNNHYP